MGSVVQLRFEVPDREEITVTAQVARTLNYERPDWYKRYHEDGESLPEFLVGVYFLDLTKDQLFDLEDHLDFLLKKEYQERKVQKISHVKESFLQHIKIIGIAVFFLALSYVGFLLFR